MAGNNSASASIHQEEPENAAQYLPDHDAHLNAIISLVAALKGWQERYDEESANAWERLELTEPDGDCLTKTFYDAAYANIAYSHAFICTIAAYVESLFKQCLPEIGKVYSGTLSQHHPRVQQFAKPKSFWDPTLSKVQQTGFPEIICDILDASGLMPQFGDNFSNIVTAIFAYRNMMIHNGFEWGAKEKNKFTASIAEKKWTNWFSVSMTDDEPWFFAITPAFQGECMNLCQLSTHVLLQSAGLPGLPGYDANSASKISRTVSPI